MKMNGLPVGACLLCLIMMGASVPAGAAAPSAQGPWLGVWKLNVSKSHYAAGKPPLGVVYAMRASGADTFDIAIDMQLPRAQHDLHMAVVGARFDGKPYLESGNPIANSDRFRITGPRSYEFFESRAGKVVITVRAEISRDGKTRISRQMMLGRSGKPIVNVAVWDRQS